MKWTTQFRGGANQELCVRNEAGSIVADLPYFTTERDAALIAAAPELAEVLAEILEASALSPGDCYTDGKPNANHGRESRAKMKARFLLAGLPIMFTGEPGAVRVA